MRSNTFHEEHPVTLTEEERNLRGRQAARLEVAAQAQKERAKEAKKKLREEEEELTEAMHKAALAAESGEEKRQVECREILRGVVVETIRIDTMATMASRPATKEELGAAPVLVPGGGAKRGPRGIAVRPPEDEAAPDSDAFATH
jgi:hypothetical protein